MYLTVCPYGLGSIPDQGAEDLKGMPLADYMCCLVHRPGQTIGQGRP